MTAKSLRGSFVRLEAAGTASDDVPGHLLLFYAVECGLKAAVLRRGNLSSTAKLREDLRVHDLRRLMKELRIGPATCPDLRHCRRPGAPKGANATVSVSAVHEAWRYGASLDVSDEQRFVKSLIALADWCRRELR